MTMEALSHQLRASEYLITPSKRRRQEGGGEDQFCFNEDDMELAKSLMMLSNGDKEKTDVKVEVLVVAPPCTVPLTESKKVSGGQCYKCSVCGKEFGSYQALGGHKASHRKTEDSSEAAAAVATVVEVEKVESHESNGRVHECEICHKRFPSGQALGGHKRRHYEGPLGKQHNNHNDHIDKQKLKEANSSNEVTTATNSDGSGTPRMHWGFDLNIPALPDSWPAAGVVTVDEEVQSLHPAKKPCQPFHT